MSNNKPIIRDAWDDGEDFDINITTLNITEENDEVSESNSPDNDQTTVKIPFASNTVSDQQVSASNEEIDQALIDALMNPRERMNVLKYEQRIIQFVKSKDNALDITSISNSYQRLLVYRIAQRFNLNRQVYEAYTESGEKGISLVKTSTTGLPQLLLYDKCKREMDDGNQSSAPIRPSSTSPDVESVENGLKQPKIVVMKRNTSKNDNNNMKKTGSSDALQTMSDKEKAYAEARARIFGSEGAAESPSQSNPPSPPKQSKPQEAGSNQQNVSRRNTSDSPKEEINEQVPNAHRVKKHVDPGNWKEKKVIIRNKDAERNDPDFTRRNVNAGQPPYTSDPYGNGGGYRDAPPLPPYYNPQQNDFQNQWSSQRYDAHYYTPDGSWGQQASGFSYSDGRTQYSNYDYQYSYSSTNGTQSQQRGNNSGFSYNTDFPPLR